MKVGRKDAIMHDARSIRELGELTTMRHAAFRLMFVIGLALAGLPGCGGSSDDKPAARVKAPESEPESPKDEIKRYDIADLPPVDEPMPRPLDGGRLELCPPADWVFSGQANYLVVFAKVKVSELPRMTVAAADSPYGTENTTEENAQSLAKNIQKKLVKDKRNVRELPKPVRLGESVWVRHVREVPQGGSPCAVQSLQIVRGGRLYTLEMFSVAKDDSQAAMAAAVNAGNVRMISYAVAANARFKEPGSATPPKGEGQPPPTAPETKPADPAADGKPASPAPGEKPAEAKPAEKKSG